MFSEFTNDTVNLRKLNGEITNNIKASVQPDVIFIEGADLLIETGDLLQRTMSNGAIETYEVIDPCFYEKSEMGSAHYQIRHKNLGLPEAEKAIQQITYNISGPNARVNNNSTDNSNNVVNINNDLSESIEALKAEINRVELSSLEKEEALEIVGAVEEQCKNEKPNKVVVNALINSLPTVASIASIGSLIVSLLPIL